MREAAIIRISLSTVFLLFFLLGLPHIEGQTTIGTSQSQLPDNEETISKNSISLFGTATLANSGFYAQSSNSHLFLLGFGYSRMLTINRIFAFSYAPEVLPAVILTQPHSNGTVISPAPQLPNQPGTAYGIGASPVGFQFLFRPSKKIKPFITASGGFVYFNRNIPSPRAAQFNFAADGGVGIRIRLNSIQALSFAYLFHHFSNAFEAADNPGVDSQMLYVGYTFNLRH